MFRDESSPRVVFEARVEELVRIWEARPVGKGKLHLIFIFVGLPTAIIPS